MTVAVRDNALGGRRLPTRDIELSGAPAHLEELTKILGAERT